MKFHPNSTPNSTMYKSLIIKAITPPRWKGGITNDKKYFSENMAEKVLTTVKNHTKQDSHHDLLLEILLIARNVLIINSNWDDKITKETNWKQHNRETPK